MQSHMEPLPITAQPCAMAHNFANKFTDYSNRLSPVLSIPLPKKSKQEGASELRAVPFAHPKCVCTKKKPTPKNNNGIFVWIGVCPCLGLSYAEHCGNTREVRDQSRKAKKARQNFREERRTKTKVTWLKCLINQCYI